MRSRRWQRAFLFVIVAGVVWLGGALIWGAYQGYRQRLDSLERTRLAYQQGLADIHYQRALQYLKNGQADLARAELEAALQAQPSHAEAAAALEQLQENSPTPLATTPAAIPAATPAAIPAATMAATATAATTTTVTSAYARGDPLAPLYQDAVAAFERQDWEATIRLLESIRFQDATYRPADVESMLFAAYRAQAEALITSERFEEALRLFDRALLLQPDADDVREEREQAALYVTGLSYWGADWQQAIARFQELYKRNPDYRDVKQRLADAYAGYAERLQDRGNWCAAVERYNESLAVIDSPTVRSSRDQAQAQCQSGVAAPTSATPGASPVGRVTIAAYDPIARRYRVFALGPGQAGPQVLLDEAAQPAWSPDRQSLAIRSLKNDELGIEVFVPSSGERRRVTRFVEDGFPSWSPDGKQIVFASNREGDRRWRIYTTWADGASPATDLGFGRAPAWSPDGQRIAYQGCDERGNQCGLWVMSPTGANRQPITNDPSDTAPAWSPDGRQIAFMSYERTGRWDIYLLQVATGKVTPLVVDSRNAGLPAWSPDGARIAFLSDRSGAWAVYTVSANGGASVKLADVPGTIDDWLSERLSWGP